MDPTFFPLRAATYPCHTARSQGARGLHPATVSIGVNLTIFCKETPRPEQTHGSNGQGHQKPDPQFVLSHSISRNSQKSSNLSNSVDTCPADVFDADAVVEGIVDGSTLNAVQNATAVASHLAESVSDYVEGFNTDSDLGHRPSLLHQNQSEVTGTRGAAADVAYDSKIEITGAARIGVELRHVLWGGLLNSDNHSDPRCLK